MLVTYSITLDGKEIARTEAFNDAADILEELTNDVKGTGGSIRAWYYDGFMVSGVDYKDEDGTEHQLRCKEVWGS